MSLRTERIESKKIPWMGNHTQPRILDQTPPPRGHLSPQCGWGLSSNWFPSFGTFVQFSDSWGGGSDTLFIVCLPDFGQGKGSTLTKSFPHVGEGVPRARSGHRQQNQKVSCIPCYLAEEARQDLTSVGFRF